MPACESFFGVFALAGNLASKPRRTSEGTTLADGLKFDFGRNEPPVWPLINVHFDGAAIAGNLISTLGDACFACQGPERTKLCFWNLDFFLQPALSMSALDRDEVPRILSPQSNLHIPRCYRKVSLNDFGTCAPFPSWRGPLYEKLAFKLQMTRHQKISLGWPSCQGG
jgi:hypothetical protein